MSARSGPFWDSMEGRRPLLRGRRHPRLAAVDADVDSGTIELAFNATEDLTSPSGNVLGAFTAAMLYDTVGPALLATLEPDQFQSTLDIHVSFAAGSTGALDRHRSRRPPRRRHRLPGGVAPRLRRERHRHRYRHGACHPIRAGTDGGLTNSARRAATNPPSTGVRRHARSSAALTIDVPVDGPPLY
jgi:hypothetical protein